MKILLIKYRALGDAVLGLSSVAYLKRLFPEASITYGVPDWVNPLFFDLETKADNFLPLNFNSLTDWVKTYLKIRRHKFDYIIELNQSGRTSKFFKLFKLLHPYTPYLGHNHNTSKGKVLDQGIKKPNIQRDLDACWTLFKKGEVPHYLELPPQMKNHKNLIKEETIVLGVVATRDSKMWPLEYFIGLMNSLIEKYGPELKFVIPLSHQFKDKLIEQELNDLGLPKEATILKASLTDLPKYLAKAKYYVGNDTGIKHICAALGIKTLTVFGIEDPLEWHPYNKEHKYICAKVPADAYKSPEKFKNCIKDIKPEMVISEISF